MEISQEQTRKKDRMIEGWMKRSQLSWLFKSKLEQVGYDGDNSAMEGANSGEAPYGV